MGADASAVLSGMPAHAVSWKGTGRLFAAAVWQAGREGMKATLFRFSGDPAGVAVRLWQLEIGADYVLEHGPTAGPGEELDSIAQTVPFRYDEPGQAVPFTLPGRTVWGVRVRRVRPAAAPPGPLPDIAVAPRDIIYSYPAYHVRIHNIGSADATGVVVRLHAGAGEDGPLLGTATIPRLEAPLDLVPRWVEVEFPYEADILPKPVTVVADPENRLIEITERNNVATGNPSVAYSDGGP